MSQRIIISLILSYPIFKKNVVESQANFNSGNVTECTCMNRSIAAHIQTVTMSIPVTLGNEDQ